MNESAVLSFATLWVGTELSPFEAACLNSFVVHGYDVTLYSYRELAGVPDGVRQCDAGDILDPGLIDAFVYAGKPDLAHFSDLFRCRMFQKTPHVWIDADVIMLRPLEDPLPATLFARELQGTICNAVLRIAPDDPVLAELDRETVSLARRDLRWGQTGPLLLTKLLRQRGRIDEAFDADLFYPLTHDEFWKVLLPEHAEECARRCRRAHTVHLFNNVLTGLGYWKRFAPPAGSFLHRQFAGDEALGFFGGVYPADVMRRMIENWRLRKSGADLGIRGLSRQIVPSIARTMRHHGVRLF